jgi:hypothetical protein
VPTERIFPDACCPAAIFHYDIALTERFHLHHPARDPSTDLIRCAENVEFVIVAPARESLKRQLIESESVGGSFEH